MFRQKRLDGVGDWFGEITLLTKEEILLVSGGEDGDAGCSPGDSGADGNCAAQGNDSNGETVGSLPEVSVTATAETIGDFAAEQMMENIEMAQINPIIAATLFGAMLANLLANAGPTPPIGNPMGDGP
jgi:hypothetical protein